MKKIYVLTVVCLALASTGSAQNYTWTGATDNNWTTASNWSSVSSGYPHLATDNAIFNTSGNASVNLNTSIDLNTLTISGGAIIKITATVNPNTITLHSTSAAAPGLKIASASSLEDDAVSGSGLSTIFVDNGQAAVAGTWILSGDLDDAPVDYLLPDSGPSSLSTLINITGKIIIGPNGYIHPNDQSDPDDYLVFAAGSALELQSSFSLIPQANYDPASSILISGVTNSGLVISDDNIGNLTYNCPHQATELFLSLGSIDIRGNLSILNTNGQNLILIGNGLGGVSPVIWGDLAISGNSVVTESKLDNPDEPRTLTVMGNFISSASFDLQSTSSNALQPTTLLLKGSFAQSGSGSLTASSTGVSDTSNLFVVEFNGSAPQTISSSAASIDNANNQVTLRINNPAGVTLNNPLAVGQIDFSGATPGVLNAGSNVLTIDNTSTTSPFVVNSPSNAAYVNGAVARRSLSTNQILFPSGTGGTLRSIGITPSDASANTFMVNLKTGSNGVAPLSPVAGLSNYYWDVAQVSGTATGVIEMPLLGAVGGASATDTLIPVAFDGTNWLDARGTTGTKIFPGNASSGSLITGVQSTFNSFAIGYAINSALPIKLLSFTGKKVQSTVELAWEITENSTPAKFEVVRSTDGVTFTSIGSLPGIVGQLNYTLTDNTIATGNNFYRLKMYDKDGAVSYSNIIVIMNGSRGILISSMIPTVVRDRARLNISSSIQGNMQLVITDISGRIVKKQVASITSGNQEVWLDASSLAPGLFQITGYINGERTTTFRFIKQ